MIDKEPAVVTRCMGAADVIAAFNLACDLDLQLAVHGGGHNIAGKAVRDGSLIIDLPPMDSVRVDPDAQTARVSGEATRDDFDHEAQAFGLATTGDETDGGFSDEGVDAWRETGVDPVKEEMNSPTMWRDAGWETEEPSCGHQIHLALLNPQRTTGFIV